MPRFTCTHHPTALEKFILPSGRFLAFDYRGVLETDEEGARVIRAHPLYNRLIHEVDEPAPDHQRGPALELQTQVVVPARRPETPEQSEKREQFAQQMAAVRAHATALRDRIETEEAVRRRELSPTARWLLDEFRRASAAELARPCL